MSISTIEAFSPAERAKLRDAGIVVFANRFIFEAQPPMPPHEAAELQAKCAGPIPRDLLDLWAETAGGNLAYDVPRVPMLGRMEALSFEQLFHPGGDGYDDLRYWVDEALEASNRRTGCMRWLGQARPTVACSRGKWAAARGCRRTASSKRGPAFALSSRRCISKRTRCSARMAPRPASRSWSTSKSAWRNADWDAGCRNVWPWLSQAAVWAACRDTPTFYLTEVDRYPPAAG